MIAVTKLNGTVFYINPHLIERIDVTPNTLLTMNSQMQFIIREGIDELNEKIIAYRKQLGIGTQE